MSALVGQHAGTGRAIVPDLNFSVEGAEPHLFAAAPLLVFKLRVAEALAGDVRPTPIHTVALRCQIRIEPARRSYDDQQRERLLDLFGTTDRWGQTLRSMLWTHVSTVVSPFTGADVADLPVPCSYDFSLAATKYFAALDDEGDLPLGFLFSGTIFYEAPDEDLRVTQIPWEKDAFYRLPVSVWRGLMDVYYPNTAWLCLRKDVFDRLDSYRSRRGLMSWEQVMERLLAAAEEAASR
jgi:hypothetical protein